MLKVQSLGEMVKDRCNLSEAQVEHIHRLLGSWQLIADLSFADLLMWCRLRDNEGFVCVGQMRPHTAQTLHPEDAFGNVIRPEEMPAVDRVFSQGHSYKPDEPSLADGSPVWVQAIPVIQEGRILAVMTIQSSPLKDRRPGRLEQNYLECGAALVKMVEEEAFPFDGEPLDPALAPRVGDGMIRLSSSGRVLYASPNAISAYRRLGIMSNIEGDKISNVGLDVTPATLALSLGAPAEGDVQVGDTVVLQRAIPLLEGAERQVVGGLLLLRDVTDLRYRERQLQSKETVISEIHHRVKNNLQTIASLLRLQARRLSSEAKAELDEAVRRIASIALVHDTLSKESTQSVEFERVAARLVGMVSDALIHRDRNITIRIEGDPGKVSSELATPLALVLVELLQNAVEHAFGTGGGRVAVSMKRNAGDIDMTVSDDGVGLPADFSLQSAGLGLQIVRTLVETELKGSLEMNSKNGTEVNVRVPVDAR